MENEVQVLRALVVRLVAEVNVANGRDCLDGYHDSLADTWVEDGDSTTVNQTLTELGLPTVLRVGEGEEA